MRHRFFLILFLLLLSLSFIRNGNIKRKDYIPLGNLNGMIYKAAWNKKGEYVFIHKDFKVLLKLSESEEEFNKTLSRGAYINLSSKLVLPDKSTNPGGFDMSEYLSGKGVSFITYIYENNIEIIDENPKHIKAFGAKVRVYINERLICYFGEERSTLVMAVMTGETGGLDSGFKKKVQLAGLSHLLAVSGSHVVIFLLPFRKLNKNRYMNIYVRNTFILIPLFAFLIITDMTPSVTRSCISAAMSCVAVVLRRRSDSLNTLGFAGSAQLLLNKYVIYDTGFILSYASSFSIVLILPAIRSFLLKHRLYNPFKKGGGSGKGSEKSRIISFFDVETLITGISVYVGLLPVMCNMFNKVSFAGILFTVIASPLANTILISGYLTVMFSFLGLDIFAKVISYFIVTITYCLEKVIGFTKVLPLFLTELTVPSKSFIIYIFYYFIIAIFILKRGKKKKVINILKKYYTGFVLVLYIALFILYRPCFTVIFYDVGQGNCTFVESSSGVKGLIDAGEGYTRVSTLLYKRGVGSLDFIVASHGHSDHIAGLYDIVDNIKVKYMFIPSNPNDTDMISLASYANKRGIKVIQVSGDTLYKPDYSISVRIFYKEDNASLNNSSLVVELVSEQRNIMIASDIEKETEQFLLEHNKVNDCDVLQVAHHGSKTSTTINFLKRVNPETAVICCGENNIYGHPDQVVTDRLESLDVNVYRTDYNGAVIFKFKGSNITIEKYGDE